MGVPLARPLYLLATLQFRGWGRRSVSILSLPFPLRRGGADARGCRAQCFDATTCADAWNQRMGRGIRGWDVVAFYRRSRCEISEPNFSIPSLFLLPHTGHLVDWLFHQINLKAGITDILVVVNSTAINSRHPDKVISAIHQQQ